MRGDLYPALNGPAVRIERVQFVSASKPDVLAVKGNPSHIIALRKGAVFADDLCFGSFHASNPNALAEEREVTRLSGIRALAGSSSGAPARGRSIALCPPWPAYRAPAAPCVGWRPAQAPEPNSPMTRRRPGKPAPP